MVPPAAGSTAHQMGHEKTHRSLTQGNPPKDCGLIFYQTLSQINRFWTSLAVQWLRLHASTAGGTGSIPVRGTKIPHAAQRGQKR